MKEGRSKPRLFVFMGVLGVLALVLLVYLFAFMVIAPAQSGNEVTPLLLAERGPILDRNNEELALQPELYQVEVWVPHLQNPGETASLLAPIIDVSRETILEKFGRSKGSIILKHQIPPSESNRIEALLKQGKLKGVYLKPKLGRIYPKQELACHVIGHVNVDNVGMAGIEYTFDQDLAPHPQSPTETAYGRQVILTIDIKLQHFMDQIALQAQKEKNATSIMILAMAAKTGEFLAYTAIPRFDPNEYTKFSESERMNRPALMAYEPGSAMKIFTLSSLLDTGAIRADDVFHCDGFYRKELPSGQQIKIRCLSAHGDVTPREIIQYSCNAGAAYASDNLLAQDFYAKLRGFGFGQKTGIDFAGESSGVFADPSRWSLRSKPTIAFGQEISVSAVQMMAAATVLANDGVLLKPRVVKRVVSPDGRTVVRSFGREPVRRVLSPATARQMLSMMEAAVGPRGSAREARIEGIRVAAKTGTAQVADPATGTYSQTNYIASIIGLFPAEAPEIILYVVVQNPKEGSYWGSRVAAPLFKKAGEELIRYLDIPRAGEQIYTQTGRIRVPAPHELAVGQTLPDLTGLPKRALHVLLGSGLEVEIRGEGYVISQNPPAGTPIRKGMKVTLTLQ